MKRTLQDAIRIMSIELTTPAIMTGKVPENLYDIEEKLEAYIQANYISKDRAREAVEDVSYSPTSTEKLNEVLSHFGLDRTIKKDTDMSEVDSMRLAEMSTFNGRGGINPDDLKTKLEIE